MSCGSWAAVCKPLHCTPARTAHMLGHLAIDCAEVCGFPQCQNSPQMSFLVSPIWFITSSEKASSRLWLPVALINRPVSWFLLLGRQDFNVFSVLVTLLFCLLTVIIIWGMFSCRGRQHTFSTCASLISAVSSSFYLSIFYFIFNIIYLFIIFFKSKLVNRVQ